MPDLESAFGTLAAEAGQRHDTAAPPGHLDDKSHHSNGSPADFKSGASSTAGPSQNQQEPASNAPPIRTSSTRPPNSNPLSDSPSPRSTQVWHFGWDRLNEEIHADDAIVPLTWQSLLTGLVDSIVFSVAQTWVGFVTGDFVQFSMNIAQYIIPHSKTDGLGMLLRGMAMSGFFVGNYATGVLGRRMGWHRRNFLVLSALVQSVLIWIAVAIALSRPKFEEPTFHWWPPMLLTTAMSMGIQSATSQKLGSAAFSTSVAFTATVSSIGSDPQVFKLWPPFSREVRARDLRLLSMVALCIGAGVGQSLLLTDLGFGGALAVAAAAKLVLVPLWWLPHGQHQA